LISCTGPLTLPSILVWNPIISVPLFMELDFWRSFNGNTGLQWRLIGLSLVDLFSVLCTHLTGTINISIPISNMSPCPVTAQLGTILTENLCTTEKTILK
jgi:hypothetical protein